jgi:hypothetical protein
MVVLVAFLLCIGAILFFHRELQALLISLYLPPESKKMLLLQSEEKPPLIIRTSAKPVEERIDPEETEALEDPAETREFSPLAILPPRAPEENAPEPLIQEYPAGATITTGFYPENAYVGAPAVTPGPFFSGGQLFIYKQYNHHNNYYMPVALPATPHKHPRMPKVHRLLTHHVP